MNHRCLSIFIFLFSIFAATQSVRAQSGKPGHLVTGHNTMSTPLQKNIEEFVETAGVSGYENQLGDHIRAALKEFHPATDNIGDITVTLGSGSPHRLIVAPMDEPGFVVSDITNDGYLRVQRLPQFGLPPIFNELYSAQPVRVQTTYGTWVYGVVAGLSVHLQPGRTDAPKSSGIENIYVDIGASSAAEVRKVGVDNLSPIVVNRRMMNLDNGAMFAGASVGDRFGAAALVELLHRLDPLQLKGTLTVAFVVQQWTGARGLQRILTMTQADEMIYVGRLLSGGPVAGTEGVRRAPRRETGSGVLLGLQETNDSLTGLAAELKQVATTSGIPFETDYSGGILPRSYLPPPTMPAKWAHIGIATAWADTPAETIDSKDLDNLTTLLESYVDASRSGGSGGGVMSGDGWTDGLHNRPLPLTTILRNLVETYGVSEHEGQVREEVKRLLPPWAKPETDDSGNLILQVGTAPAGTKAPSILVVAHMDEIGYVVKSISKDGRLEVDSDGGGVPSYFEGHAALVHTPTADIDAVMELPSGWDEPNFKWPTDRTAVVRVDVGARTPEEVAKLGIKAGDTITIPKAYRELLGKRANGRSFDDRVGDTALISAAWALGGPLKDRNVTFVFSTGEELGLFGAGDTAKRLAAQGHIPDYVFAVDTFVSADSPLESKRFGDAEIGKGFVIRAVDNSNIVRPDLVEKLIKLARANQAPVQFGVTGGGNDGSAFVRYGSADIALGWPLRYSHSPAEVIDTRDVDALARIITAIAKSW
jgi:putative aminopeptidase